MLWDSQIVLYMKGLHFRENTCARIALHDLGAIPELKILLREIFLKPNLLNLVLPDLGLVETYYVGVVLV